MPGMNYEFDASQFEPNQGNGGGSHPIGRWPFEISKTEIKAAQSGSSGYLAVTYRTEVGEAVDRFNLWHENPTTVRIANEQLSALCRAVGIWKVSMTNEGAALVGGRGVVEIVKQTGEGGEKGYTQVAKRLDPQGNEPTSGNGPAQGQNAGPQNGQGFQGGGNQPFNPGNTGGGAPQNGQGFQPQNGQQGGGFQQNGQQPQQQGQQPNNGGGAPAGGGWNNPNNGGGQAQQPQNGQAGGWQQGGGNAPAGGNGGGPSWGQR